MNIRLLILFLYNNISYGWNFIINNRPKVNINIWDNTQFNNTKFISITPGGIYGFYNLGISLYILNNYQLNNYSFIGASAGAWNSLICTYKYNHSEFIHNLFDNVDMNTNDVHSLQNRLSEYILNTYKTDDFNLDKLHICISEFD